MMNCEKSFRAHRFWTSADNFVCGSKPKTPDRSPTAISQDPSIGTTITFDSAPRRTLAGRPENGRPYVEGRDAHAVSDIRTVPENDRFDLYQAYLRIGDTNIFPLSLKAGRQELIYGDQRYIGNSDWSNLGRSFDSVKLRYENDFFWLDAFTGRLVLAKDGRFNNPNHSDWFSGLYASTQRLASWQETDLFFLANNIGGRSTAEGGQKPRDVYTLGTRWKSLPGKLGGWDYSFEAAGQFGSIPENSRRFDHRGYAVNIAGGRTWNDAFGAPRLGVGYDFGSGDSNPADDREMRHTSCFSARIIGFTATWI